MRMIFDVTTILTVTVVSIQMGLVLNWALLTAVFKAINRVRQDEQQRLSKSK
jgi:hypothetical protein